MLHIRLATLEDIPAITDIYNEAIIYTPNTFDTIPKTVADRERWFHEHMPAYPILVAVVGGIVVGFASISKWSTRPAYRHTVSASIYLHEEFRGQGIGKKLLTSLVQTAFEAGFHTLMGNIYEGNRASLHLFQAVGFSVVGLLKEVGYKFDEWLDVYLVQMVGPVEKTGHKFD